MLIVVDAMITTIWMITIDMVSVKDTGALLPYCSRTFFNNTWTGDTHKETDVLPSTRREEDSG